MSPEWTSAACFTRLVRKFQALQFSGAASRFSALAFEQIFCHLRANLPAHEVHEAGIARSRLFELKRGVGADVHLGLVGKKELHKTLGLRFHGGAGRYHIFQREGFSGVGFG